MKPITHYSGKKIRKKLYVHAAPDVMRGHKFKDDVAITYALNKHDAWQKLERFYHGITEEDITEPYFNYGGVAILTDY